jgi:blocked early in transport 1
MNYRAYPKAATASVSARSQLFGTANGGVPPPAAVTMRANKKDARDGQSVSEQARMILEEQNNREIAALGEKVSMMRFIASDIEAAIKDDHELLNQTGSTFDRVSSMMKGTLGNVNKMLTTGGSKHMCYLIAFIVCLFMTLYWLMR